MPVTSMGCRRLPWVFARLAVLWALAATAAHACTGFLVREQVVKSKRGGYTKLCYYDHLGDTYVITVPGSGFCKVSINVRHDNEDRDGDGVEDDEEDDQDDEPTGGTDPGPGSRSDRPQNLPTTMRPQPAIRAGIR